MYARIRLERFAEFDDRFKGFAVSVNAVRAANGKDFFPALCNIHLAAGGMGNVTRSALEDLHEMLV
jgi:hypothetical protein